MNENKEKLKKEIEEQLSEIKKLANKGDLYYVACFWESPTTHKIGSRYGFFDSFTNASPYYHINLVEYCKHNKLPYHIESNMGFPDDWKGNLFSEDN